MSAFTKELLRTIARAPGRFLALLAIVALGAGFYAGLRMCAPDMDRALDRYFDDTNAYDIRVVSTLGLTDDDLVVLRAVEGVETLEGAFECDAVASMNGSDYTMRFHSLPEQLNNLSLVEGEWPQANNECVICADRIMDTPFAVGDAIQLAARNGSGGASAGGDSLAEGAYTVVGLVRSPYYVSQVSLGTSSVGSGIVQQFVYVPAADFKRTVPYAEAFLSVEGARDEFMGSDAYWQRVGEVKQRIQDIAPEREQHRLDTLSSLSSLRFSDELPSYRGFLDLLDMRLNMDLSSDDDLTCEWLVMDRDKNVGAKSFSSDAERVDHIASVFPFVFFLVAALVALTTMTRMVDEERMLIGTFKALGYSQARITGKYLVYAFAASGIGSAIGIVVLGQLLPAVIMNAYAIMYRVPNDSYPLDPALTALSAGLSIGICLVSTWFAVARTLRERPAALMLPPAPKTGKRILLERVGPVWRRLSFSWKVTCRNLFRYKKRLVMTLIGIAGCTALLLTGLGLHDAINDIIDVQYTDIVHDNATITLTSRAAKEAAGEGGHAVETAGENANAARGVAEGGVNAEAADEGVGAQASGDAADEGVGEQVSGDAAADAASPNGASEGRQAVQAVLDDANLVYSYTPAHVETMLASGPRASDKRCDVVVPIDPQAFENMMTLRTRVGHEPLELRDGEAIINEKMSIDLGVSVGDELVLAEQDTMGNATSTTYTVKVSGLSEIYIYNFVFMNERTYTDIWGKAPVQETYFADVTTDPQERSELDSALASTGAVKTAAYNDETIGTYRTMLRSVDLIVVVLVVSAAALAFIVLYNLTNINIAERVREIATLKVLGFTRGETRAYIFREVTLLSILGCLIGLVIGVPLESFVVTTAEVDQVMFGRTIHALSFAIGFVLTLVFAAASMLLMFPKLTRIDMVESLKSNE